MSEYKEMSFFKFQEQFRTDIDCFEYLKKLRWPEGFICPKCGCTEAYFMEKRTVFQCKSCRQQVSITVNTIKKLENMIGVHYATAWLMIHKIRKAMEDRNSLYKLKKFIEMDDSYFGGSSAGKRGRGAANKSLVAIAVENRGTAPGFASMKVIDSMNSNNLEEFALKEIVKGQTIHTDDYPSYNVLKTDYTHFG